MFSKLAIQNVKKSIKDYTVYFLTLMLGVCIFYVFNSLDAQSAMLEVSASAQSAMQVAASIVKIVSVLVSCVLAFLIIYANNFMIKRRKKELGIYMTLGMPQGKLSRMLVLETVLIGLIALAAGLLLGIFLSQGLAVVTAKLFDVRVVNFHFIFSKPAFFQTIVYFGIIFLVVVLFMSRTVSKYKLIDLMNAGRKNEELKVRKKSTTTVLFILGAALIGLSYYLVIRGGAGMILYTFAPALLVNVVGSLLFFMSLSGFMLRSAQANKKTYYKGLNMFVMRQLNNRVTTNFVSMTFICTMLFLTIVILSTVTSFNTVFNKETEIFTPYDISFTMGQDEGGANTTLTESLPKVGVNAGEVFEQSYEYEIFGTDVLMKEIAQPNVAYLTDEAAERVTNETVLDAVKVSDFNKLMEMQGKDTIVLGPDEFAVTAMNEGVQASAEEYVKDPWPVTIAGKEMTPADLGAMQEGLWTTGNGFDLMLILPDEVAAQYTPKLDVYVADFKGDVSEYSEWMDGVLNNINAFGQNTGITIRSMSRTIVTQANNSTTTSLIFVGVYLGLVFLIAAAAILALQQLSEAADNKTRYDMLKKLGTDEGMINQSILKQVGIYFFLPLALAIVHSAVGMWVMNEGIIIFGSVDVIWSAFLSALFILVVYGGYFLATYFGCRNIVHAKYERVE